MRILLMIANCIRTLYWKLFNSITLGVRLIAMHEGKLLLVRHTYRDSWFLPGGGVRKKETLEQAIRRETFEETGARVDNLSLLGMYTDFHEGRSNHIAFFCGKVTEYNPKTNIEIEKADFFPLNNLPEDLSQECVPGIRDFLARAGGVHD